MKLLVIPILLLLSTSYSQGQGEAKVSSTSSIIREGDRYSYQIEDGTTRDHQVPWSIDNSIELQLVNTLQDVTASGDEINQSKGDLLDSVESGSLFSNPSDDPSSDPDNDDGDTQGYNSHLLMIDQLKEEIEILMKEKKEHEAEISYLKMSLDNCKTFCRKTLTIGDGIRKGGDIEGEGVDVDHGVGDTHVSINNREREGRRLVATVSSDKEVLQGIAPSVGSKAGTPAWNSTGDPCNDRWYGVTCDASGYVTVIILGGKSLSGINMLSISLVWYNSSTYISSYHVLQK
jgi:hypothetical protein